MGLNICEFISNIAFSMMLCHPPDATTSPKYKLMLFKRNNFFFKEKNALAFNLDRCCQLVLCLWFITFHYRLFEKNMINDKVTDISGTVTVGTAKHVYRTALKIVMTGWKRKNDGKMMK